MIEPEAVAVNVQRGLILLDTNETVEIDTMIDADGDETDDPDLALAALAPLPDGRWIVVDLTAFERAQIQ